MEINSDKIKEKFKHLPNGYAETVAEEHNCSPSLVRYAKASAEDGEKKLRERTLSIIESLVLLADENQKSNDNPISRINSLL